MVHVLGQVVEAEVLGDAVSPRAWPPARRRPPAASRRLPLVGAFVRARAAPAGARHLGHRLGDDVECSALQRQASRRQPISATTCRRPAPRCRRHRPSAVITPPPRRRPFSTRMPPPRCSRRCALRWRPLGIGHGGVDRIGLAVVGRPAGTADHAAPVEQRVASRTSRRRSGTRPRRRNSAAHRAGALAVPRTAPGQRHATEPFCLEAGGLAGLGFQRPAALGRCTQRVRSACASRAAHQAGGMPVVPQVSWRRSSTTTSVMPRCVRW